MLISVYCHNDLKNLHYSMEIFSVPNTPLVITYTVYVLVL